jgi:hypothetical protein
MINTRNQNERTRTERDRGWIVYFLYHALPRALEIPSLRTLLDARNIPLSSHRLAGHLSYLAELRLVKVELGRNSVGADENQQGRALERYSDSDRDGLNEAIFVRLTTAGINFQEGVGIALEGVSRVE